MPTQLADVIQPDAFTAYQVQNSMVSTALYQSGVALPNGEMDAQLSAGAELFTVPYWNDLPDICCLRYRSTRITPHTSRSFAAIRRTGSNRRWLQPQLAALAACERAAHPI